MVSIEQVLVAASVLLLISIIASKASGRLGIPALLLFLGIGMLAGSEGIGGIYFDDARVAQSVGVVSLVLILFAGGLDTVWTDVRPVLRQGLALATVGVVVTALLVALFARLVLGFSWMEGLLLGAVISPTDAAAVFSVLRSNDIKLKGRLEPLLELESGSNDPMAVFLTLGLLQVITNPATTAVDLLLLLVRQAILGLAFGYGLGRGAVYVINRLKLRSDGLYPVFTLAFVLMTYGVTASLGGSGFLAVYLAGIIMGNSEFIHKRSLMHFHDGLAWLMQIVMFLTLGLLVFPSHLLPIAGLALLTAFFLILVARPIATFGALALARLSVKEKALVSWVGLRGAVPIVLATFPLLEHVSKADMIFNLVFFVVLTSVLIQGTSIPFVARLLDLNQTSDESPASKGETQLATPVSRALSEVNVPGHSSAAGKQIVELHLPENALVVLIGRDGQQIVPKGSSEIRAHDTLLILANPEDLARVRAILNQ
jgi:cell volume regulation protein A